MDILSYILGYDKGKATSGTTDTTTIEALNVTANGTYTAPEGKAYSPVTVSIAGGSSSFSNEIFPLQTVEGFAPSEDFGGLYVANSPTNFVINKDKVYIVEWDDAIYTCKGIEVSFEGVAAIYLGNGAVLGYGGNNEPFAIGYSYDIGAVSFFAVDGSTEPTHNIRVYQNYELKEIVPTTQLTFAVGNSTLLPNTPAAIIADSTAVAEMEIINNGENGLVIFDKKLYAVYAGSRNTAPVEFPAFTQPLSISGAIGNIGIPSAFSIESIIGPVVEETASAGESDEPFFAFANKHFGFQVAIPEDSTEFTHTIQILKFV